MGKSNEYLSKLDYEAPLVMDFDTQNRPYFLNNTKVGHNLKQGVYQITSIRNNKWVHFSYLDELKEMFGESIYINEKDLEYQGFNASRSSQMMIDDSDNLFAVIGIYLKHGDKISIKYVLISANNVSSNKFNGEFKVSDIFPKGASMAVMEVRNSFNGSKKYAPLFAYCMNQPGFPYKTPHAWSQHNYSKTYLINAYYSNDQLKFKEKVLLDDKIPGFCKHSSGETFAVTKGNYSFITYLRHDSDPKIDPDGNNRVYIKKFNRETNKFETDRKFLFDCTPKFADGHSIPVVAIDKNGYIYIQSGAHAGAGFKFTKNTKALEISSWETPKEIGKNRTYSSLLIDKNNKMHSFFRSDRPYKLFYQNGDTKKGFENNNGILFVDQNSKNGYRVYYNHACKDRENRIYISWTPNSGADYKTWDFRRVLAYTDDSGKTWKIPKINDFIKKIKK
jgi:hypothetical protein